MKNMVEIRYIAQENGNFFEKTPSMKYREEEDRREYDRT